jgi:hypothetical protein
MDRNDMRARTPVVQGSSSHPPVAQGRPSPALFHFANALGLPDIVPGDGDWRQLGHVFRWFLAVAQERDKYVDSAAALPARLLLNGSGQVAAPLPPRALQEARQSR